MRVLRRNGNFRWNGKFKNTRKTWELGVTQNPVSASRFSGFKTRGIITPRSDNFLIDGVRFHKYTNANFATFGSCSRCEESCKFFYFKFIF